MLGYWVLAAGSVAWFAPFLWHRRSGVAPQKVNPRARWGVVLVGAGYAVPWQTAFWTRAPEAWRVALSASCLLLACVFSWNAARALGKHWRIAAGLDADHELVQTGIYGVVRHPIYTSMLFVIVGTCVMLAPLYLLPLSALSYAVGTEIRVHERYKANVPRWWPRATPWKEDAVAAQKERDA
jgi:protein-S-isoprenylcysteine O-methyltransferase Ste14